MFQMKQERWQRHFFSTISKLGVYVKKIDGFELYVVPHYDFFEDGGGFVKSMLAGYRVTVVESVVTPIGERVTTWRLSMDGSEDGLSDQQLCDRVRTLAKPQVVWRYR